MRTTKIVTCQISISSGSSLVRLDACSDVKDRHIVGIALRKPDANGKNFSGVSILTEAAFKGGHLDVKSKHNSRPLIERTPLDFLGYDRQLAKDYFPVNWPKGFNHSQSTLSFAAGTVTDDTSLEMVFLVEEDDC